MGRIAELAVFERAITEARTGMPSVLLVGGDAGIGKTTIVTETASRAGVALYRGRSTHIGGEVIPLAALADLLRQVRRSAPDLSTDIADLAPQGGLFPAVLELVTQLTLDDAVVVAFEDLHWADMVTWDLFEFLARNLIDEQVVLVGTFRANEVGAHPAQRQRLAELIRIPATRRIQLEGLGRAEVAAGITALIGKPASTVLVDQIVARGQGNPFFTRELVTAHLAGETIPIVLSDLISAEIAGLDDAARGVLSAVAAFGREISHELLAAIVALSNDEVEAAVRTAIDAKLLVVDKDSDAYRFRHPLLGEVVYADLLPPQRARLHRRIAETLQEQTPAALGQVDRAGELAFHFDRAGDKEGAFVALLAAADAAEMFAPDAAFGHLQRAFELWDAVGERATVADRGDRMWQLAELATHGVSNARAAEFARAAFDFGPPRLGAAWAHERIGRYLWTSGQLAESRVEFERAAELLASDDRADAALVFAGLGQADLMFGNYDKAQDWCAKVFDLVADPADNRAAWVMARRVLGVVRSNQADPEDAVALCREAVATAVGAQALAFATVYLCVALLDAGDNQAAINTALDAVAQGQLTGLDRAFGGYLDSLAAEGLTRVGRWPEAQLVLERHPLDNTLPVGLLRIARAKAMVAARRGDANEAASQLAQARAQPVDGWHQTILYATSADVHLALGNWAEAADAAELGWNSAAEASALWAARFAMFSVTATVERTLDELARREPVDVAQTVAQLRQRIDTARALADRSGKTHSRDVAAQLAQAEAGLTRLGESDADAWAEATARASDLGDRWATARAQVREAEAAAAIGAADRAASCLREAHSTASDLGATPLLVEIEDVARRTRISIEAPTRVALDETSANRLGLTAREAEVLSLVAAGRTNRQIGEELFVSDKTASVHVSNILRKLGVATRVDAAAVAQRLGVA